LGDGIVLSFYDNTFTGRYSRHQGKSTVSWLGTQEKDDECHCLRPLLTLEYIESIYSFPPIPRA
jgi:hypothetical protein